MFDNIIVNVTRDNKLTEILTELFISGRNLKISFVINLQSYSKTPKDARLNTVHFFVMKVAGKQRL